jgi:hypothetical protein
MTPAYPSKASTVPPLMSLPAQPRLLVKPQASCASKPLHKGKLGDASPRAPEGMPDRRDRAGSRSWPPSTVRPTRAMQNILPHNIRIKAITLQYFHIS